MTYRVVMTQTAQNDLQELFDYISQDSPFMAEKLLDELIKSIDFLSEYPLRHPLILNVGSHNIHQFIFKKVYRILYSVSKTQISILHCYRCERDLNLLIND